MKALHGASSCMLTSRHRQGQFTTCKPQGVSLVCRTAATADLPLDLVMLMHTHQVALATMRQALQLSAQTWKLAPDPSAGDR